MRKEEEGKARGQAHEGFLQARRESEALMRENVKMTERLDQISEALDGLYEAAKEAFPEAYEQHLRKMQADGAEGGAKD